MTHASVLERAAPFVWKNARLLDRRLFAFRFEDGAGEDVMSALRAYRNADGGFGHALEPDIRAPHSQPIHGQIALEVMDQAGFDMETARGLCGFLQGVSAPEGGVACVLPTVRDYPRAPWWQADGEPQPSLNPSAALAGLLLKHGVSHPWVEKAAEWCRRTVDVSNTTEPHELICIFYFLEGAPDREWAERAFDRVAERMRAAGVVALDPDATGYVQKPLDFAPTPGRMARRLFSGDVLAAHLDALAARQQEDGGWGITWPAVSPACEQEWRGHMTVQALVTLHAYGRM